MNLLFEPLSLLSRAPLTINSSIQSAGAFTIVVNPSFQEERYPFTQTEFTILIDTCDKYVIIWSNTFCEDLCPDFDLKNYPQIIFFFIFRSNFIYFSHNFMFPVNTLIADSDADFYSDADSDSDTDAHSYADSEKRVVWNMVIEAGHATLNIWLQFRVTRVQNILSVYDLSIVNIWWQLRLRVQNILSVDCLLREKCGAPRCAINQASQM